MTPFARRFALALHAADPTRPLADCFAQALRRERLREIIAADKLAAKRSDAAKAAWRIRRRKARAAAGIK